MKYEEFSDTSKWYKNKKENQFAIKLSIDDIKARDYDIDIKNPNEVIEENISYQSLLKEASTISNEIDELIRALNE